MQTLQGSNPYNLFSPVNSLTKNEDPLATQIMLVRDLDRSIGQNYGENRKFWNKKCFSF